MDMGRWNRTFFLALGLQLLLVNLLLWLLCFSSSLLLIAGSWLLGLLSACTLGLSRWLGFGFTCGGLGSSQLQLGGGLRGLCRLLDKQS